MSPLRQIVRHEWRLWRGDPVTSLALCVFGGLVIVALVLGTVRARLERRDVAALGARVETQTIELVERARAGAAGEGTSVWGPTHPDYVANERGTYAALPAAPLLALAAGQSNIYPNHYRITARLRESQIAGEALENPLMLFTGHFDAAFLMIFLYPLVILAASADLTAAERQSGTLRMMLTQGVPLRTIVSAKMLARAMLVAGVPIAVALAAAPLVGTEGNAPQRLVLWTAACVSYGAFWLGLALLVNALVRTSAGIALTLAGIWLGLVVLVPSIGNLTVRLAYPVPSRVEFATAMRAATRDAMVEGSQLLGRFLEDHPAGGTGVEGMRQYAMLQAVRDREIARRAAPLQAVYDRQLARQRRTISALQYVSPAILMQLALTDIAGASGDRHRSFHAQATAFQAEWRGFFEPRILAVDPLGPADVERMPRFAYVEETLGDVLRRRGFPTLALALAAIMISLLGLRAYARYDVTGAA
jgi:ABC-2 type transport system permease protein